MHLWGETLTFSAGFFLLLAIALALAFEFVNGFHDTANAVATVIYTNTLKPIVAVVWAGMWNLFGALGIRRLDVLGYFGVVIGGSAVAYSIVSLLPPELVLNTGSGAGLRHDLRAAGLGHSLERGHVVPRPAGLELAHVDRFAIMGVGLADSLMCRSRLGGRHQLGPSLQESAWRCCFRPSSGSSARRFLLLLLKARGAARRISSRRPRTRRRLRRFGSAACW